MPSSRISSSSGKFNHCRSKSSSFSPGYRGQGIATQLLKHLIDTDKHAKWSLNCDYDNEGAFKLYSKLGFKENGDIDLYGHQYHHMTLN